MLLVLYTLSQSSWVSPWRFTILERVRGREREREDFKLFFYYIVTLNLMDHDEEYECNIPNAYARLITAGTGFEICHLSFSL